MRLEAQKLFIIQHKKNIIKLVVAFLVSCSLAILSATVYSALYPGDYISIIQDLNNKNKKDKEIVYNVADFKLINYSLNGDVLNTTTNDPMMYLNGNLNNYVSTITLEFNKPLESYMDIQVYYTNNGKQFNADQALIASAFSGSNQCVIPLNQYVEQLRLDLGTVPNQQFSLKDVIINDKISMQDIKHAIKLELTQKAFHGIWNDRFLLFLLLFMFIGIHFIFPIKSTYRFLFRKRWLVAGTLLLFIVMNKYNGDSITEYNEYGIQYGQGSEYVQPVFGVPRGIRSDVWLVNTPSLLSAHFGDQPFSKYNYVMRGTKTLNSILGIYKGYSTIGKNIFQSAFFVLGTEYAFSFYWFAPIILLFLVSIELFLIISRRNALLSVAGAVLIVFSSYYLWWSFPIYILAAQGAIVCAYHFLYAKEKWKKLLFGLGVAIATSTYITNLYPAWQVPAGYVCLVLLIWIIQSNWNKVKELDKKDWLIFGASLLFMITLVLAYFRDIREYSSAILQTVYPGKRFISGGNSFYRLFYYFQSTLYPYKNVGNPSDAGVFTSFFPIPMIAAIYLWFKQKKKDWLVSGLVIVSFMLLLYSTFGMPNLMAKITLMSYSTIDRVTDIIGYIQIYFIIIVLSNTEIKKRINPVLALVLGGTTAYLSYYYSNKHFPNYTPLNYTVIAIILITAISYCMLAKVPKKAINIMLIGIILISVISGYKVHPIMKGLDAIYSKPVSSEISKIAKEDKNAKWITYGTGIVLPGFAIANGASTINSVNTYPNLELWHSLDPSLAYVDVYNRFSHVSLNLTGANTSMTLTQSDCFLLSLNVNDVNKIGVKYILATSKIDETAIGNLKVQKIYDEYGCYIYKVVY